ncbi:SCO family protein [Pseudoroseicyclus aestuarii]|uniref:Protein SCO1/2 n=1 Tax=Pseudoroseicyclus aestuarii TaxID=1795041 RepID=A0A318ST42_9RHOB|nr:SCO family protein [Pseudoroseicyclus aestuarii]PYE84873.1 protein SCO1/2 [Pseudoroseicyclus aestuarii]
MTRSTMRLVGIALWTLVALAVAGVLWLQFGSGRGTSAQLGAPLGQGDYSLVTTEGEPFTQATLEGQPTAVFFGFTHCPEVCPTTLGDIAAWQEDVSDLDQDLRVFFVSIDPDRDTPEVLEDYVSWAPGVTGVTGTQEEVDAAAKAFRIYARKVPLEGGDYTMDHSALVLLFDEEGRFVEPIQYQEDYAVAEGKIRTLLEG